MTDTLVNTPAETKSLGIGRVTRVIGPVVDVEFPADQMPDIYNALLIDIADMGATVLYFDASLFFNLINNKPENYSVDNATDPVCTTPDASTCTPSSAMRLTSEMRFPARKLRPSRFSASASITTSWAGLATEMIVSNSVRSPS